MSHDLPDNFSGFFHANIFDIDGIPTIRPTCAGIVKLKGEPRSFIDNKLFCNIDGVGSFNLLLDLYEKSMLDEEERNQLKSAYKVAVEKKYRIRLDEDQFDTLTPMLYYFELSEILRYGLEKSYEQKEDDLQYLKGKLLIKKNIINQIKKKPCIPCRYWDLTTDTFPNQVLLRAANILMKKKGLSTEIKNRFLLLSNIILKESVSPVEIVPDDFVLERRIPKRYELAYYLAEGIIKRYYHSSSVIEKVECPSFVFDAARIWESFLRVCIKKRLSREGWTVMKLGVNMTLLEPSKNITPDIMAVKSINGETHRLIIDAKYKIGEQASDLYQLCMYLNSYYYNKKGEKLMGLLLYYDSDKDAKSLDYTYYPQGKEEHDKEFIPIKTVFLRDDLNNHILPSKRIDIDGFSNNLIEKYAKFSSS